MTKSRVLAALSALIASIAIVIGVGAQTAGALQPNPLGNGLKPVLGWSSWSALRMGPTAALVKAEADAMVSSGLQAAGYEYINLDDFYYYCPSSAGPTVDQWGRWVTNTTTFPGTATEDGIQVLADYIHSKGLKFGIYLTPGISGLAVTQKTPVEANASGVELGTPSAYTADQIALTTTEQNYNCRGMRRLDWVGHGDAAQLYYNSLADRFASWGVDFIKYDGIEDYSTPDLDGMAKAIAQSSNPHMLLDTTEGDYTIAIAPAIVRDATQWEYTPDIENNGGALNYTSYGNVAARFNSVALWQPYVGPGNFQDLDSVEIGNGSSPGIGGRMDGITVDGRKTLLSLWSLASSPLIIGPDLTNLDPVDKDLLTNPDMLAVDQDGIAAGRISGGNYTTASTYQVFAKKETNGDGIVGLFNTTSGSPQTVSTTASAIGMPASASGYLLTDLWAHTKTETAGTIAAAVPPQGAAEYRVTPITDATQAPPSTLVSVSGPTTYSPGQTATVTETFVNNGVLPATGVTLSLAGPAGWTVTSQSATTFSYVSTGQSVSTTFRVVAPATTVPSAALTATASFGWQGGTSTTTATQTVKVAPSVKINEVRTGVTGATTNQFIELFNSGTTAVDASNWAVVYRTSATTTDTAVATIPAGTTIAAGGYYLLGRATGYTGTPAADQTFTTNISGTNGALGLRDSTGALLIDSVGWGSATNALLENCAAPAIPTTAAPGSALARIPNGRDTDSNCSDFAVTTAPSPRAANILAVSGTTGPGATVPSVLSLTLGTPASFGALSPGVTKDYTASMTANVLSTAGDAALSVTDTSATATGHLVNGTYSLASPLQAAASSPAGVGSAFAPLSAVAGAPLTLLTYSAAVSNDPVTLSFQQHVAATDPLRAGSYTKTLTFTLSTTTP
jgi:hypothetical protein